jgi:hypothetical protein
MESLTRLFRAIAVYVAAIIFTMAAWLTQMRIDSRDFYIQPTLATCRAGLTTSFIDRVHFLN